MNTKRIITAFAVLALAVSTFGQSRKGTLVFNTFNGDPNSFGFGGAATFNGWPLQPPSSQVHRSFSFGVPDDLDSSQPLTVELHFLVFMAGGVPNSGNVVITCDSFFGDTLLPQTQGTRTTTIAVTSPPNEPRVYNHYVATFSIPGEAAPRTFGILDFYRSSGDTASGPYVILTSATVHYTPIDVPPTKFANISTRARVETGDNVIIGGIIVSGQTSKRVIFRAIGPSLTSIGVSDALSDPVLDVYDGTGALVAHNDNWRSTQELEIIKTGIPPSNDLESASIVTVQPGSYTAIVSGVGGATGVALVEAYDLN